MSLLQKVSLILSVLMVFHQHTALATASTFHKHNDLDTRYKTCPNTENLAPCVCTVDETIHKQVDLSCLDIVDEQQLYDIFHTNIPDPHFTLLDLNTDNLESLSADVFGDAIFEVVVAHTYGPGGLSSIDSKTFMKSSSILKTFALSGNSLQNFPYDTLPNYTTLVEFDISANPIKSFPIIESKSLRSLVLNDAQYDAIPNGALDGLPNLFSFSSFGTDVTQVPKGLFASLSKLMIISFGACKLDHLTSGQFEVSSTMLQNIFLAENQITTVDPDTFKGVQSASISLYGNDLTILPEETWKSVLDAGNTLRLYENPLTCGCDVAWLVLEPSYHQYVGDAHCANDGGRLVDLDPIWFENNC